MGKLLRIYNVVDQRFIIKTCNEAMDIKVNARNGWGYDELIKVMEFYKLRRVAEFSAGNITEIYVEQREV
jgi:hypothetical protein